MGSLRQLHVNHDKVLKFRGHDIYLLDSHKIEFDDTIDGFIWNYLVYAFSTLDNIENISTIFKAKKRTKLPGFTFRIRFRKHFNTYVFRLTKEARYHGIT